MFAKTLCALSCGLQHVSGTVLQEAETTAWECDDLHLSRSLNQRQHESRQDLCYGQLETQADRKSKSNADNGDFVNF